MESLGQYLSAQRKIRGISLIQVSNETKIAVNWLEAIENDQWDILPGQAFTKGFVKAYARSLAIDEEDVLLRYLDIENTLKELDGSERNEIIPEKQPKERNKYLVPAIALSVVFLLLILLYIFLF